MRISHHGLAPVALAALLACAPLAATHAQSAPATVRISIGAMPLGPALNELARQANLELSFPADIVAGKTAPAVAGDLTVRQALDRILAGTGLDATIDGATVVVRPVKVTTLPQVSVAAAADPNALPEVLAGGQVARGGRLGLLGNSDVMDTPFNTISYTSKFMEDRQTVTLADVLQKDSSVRFTGQIGGITDSFFVRGFPIGEGNVGEIAFDGVYGIAPNYHVFTDYVERVEVIKGPGALLYGMSPNSGVGGVVNVVPKRSLPEDLTRVSADYMSDAQLGARIDVSRRFGENREWGLRFNGMHREGDTALDNQKSRTDIGALSLDYRGDRFRATLDTVFQGEKIDAPTRPMLVASGLQVPGAPDGHRNVTQSWGWWRSDSQSVLLHGEYDVTDAIMAFADLGGATVDIDRLSDQTPTILNAAGDVSSTPSRYAFNVLRYTYDAGLRARFNTGAVAHTLALQGSIYRDRIENASRSGTAILSNIYSPIAAPYQDIAAPTVVPRTSASDLSGVSLADTMSFLDDTVDLTLGIRQQNVQSNNYSATTGAITTFYDKSAVTPLAGIVFKPWRNVSLYGNYIEGLSKGDVAPATATNAYQTFAPYKAKQKEVGVKTELGSAIVTFSAFQIAKPSGQLVNGAYEASGEQRNRGLELGVSGSPARGVRLLGGITFIDAKLTSTNSPLTLGNQAPGVPKVAANLGGEWDLPWVAGLALNANMIYTGKQYVNQANTQSLPSWVTFDFGARYATRIDGKATTFRATLANAFNRAYWAGAASYGTISQGVPRTFMFSASMDF